MADKLSEPIASFRTTITDAIINTDTTIQIDSVTDDDGNSMDTLVLFFVIDKGTSREEYIKGTVGASSTELTSVTRGISVKDGATSVSALKFAHRKKAPIEITDHPYLALALRILNGTDAMDAANRPILDADVDATDDKEFITQAQANRLVTGGVTNSRVIHQAVAGETVGQFKLTFLDTDGEWDLADADTASKIENVQLGMTMGTGTDGVAITGGVLRAGRMTEVTGLTPGAIIFASDTAGEISESAGTKEVVIGQADDTGVLIFAPRYSQQLTEDQQDALAGSSGTPSASNAYVVEKDEDRNTGVVHYAASTAGSDTYAITLSPVITAYKAGQMFGVLADVGNIDGCTLNVDGLGAKNIKTQAGSDPATGYINAASLFVVRYDGTNMVLQSPSALLENTAYAQAKLDLQNDKWLFQGQPDGALSAWTEVKTGSALVNYAAANLFYRVTASGEDAGHSAPLVREIGNSTIQWDDTSTVRIFAKLQFSATTDQDFFLGLQDNISSAVPAGGVDVTRHMGIFVVDNVLKVSMADGSTQETSNSAATVTDWNDIELVCILGTSVELILNGTTVATLSTNVPLGTNSANYSQLITGSASANKDVVIATPLLIEVDGFSS